ncbi:hypothetical protein DV515_00015675 [Chloebia gouldiae]|uniref:Uncharacterized protein n=1 Tax=Chloebia gouldiae TaxID=44316 RepID=A0A3L8RUR9_CHLGU|nr:hypothetical protein DV515_00015675 [Chloebia gouldiae]
MIWWDIAGEGRRGHREVIVNGLAVSPGDGALFCPAVPGSEGCRRTPDPVHPRLLQCLTAKSTGQVSIAASLLCVPSEFSFCPACVPPAQ